MPLISSDQLRNISVKTVEMFLNEKIPLSEGLAKQASLYELNAEQTQRAVESTNSIAYLKILGMAEDRTVEFPLCKYAEVLHHITIPVGMNKQASVVVNKTITDKTEGMIKQASEEDQYVPTPLTDGEKRAYFIKLAAANQSDLEALLDRETTLIPTLYKAASIIKSDPEGLEKLATVCEGKTFTIASALVYGEAQPYADTGLFKEAELVQAENLLGLLKEAKELQAEISEKTELAERSELVKQAFLAAIGAGLGRLAGAIIKAPISAVAGAAGRSAANAGAAVNNAARKAMGAAELPVSKKKFGLVAGAMTAGGIAADSSFYKPGVDSTTGRSNDVWTGLQREPN